jgi:hypothetical protein
MTKPLRSWQLLRQKFVRDRSALAGLMILMGLVITAVLAPYLAPFRRMSLPPTPPSACGHQAGSIPSARTPWGEMSTAVSCTAGVLRW